MTNRGWDRLETFAQVTVGFALVQSMLHIFGVPLQEALISNVGMFILSALRQYYLRRAFRKLRGWAGDRNVR